MRQEGSVGDSRRAVLSNWRVWHQKNDTKILRYVDATDVYLEWTILNDNESALAGRVQFNEKLWAQVYL